MATSSQIKTTFLNPEAPEYIPINHHPAALPYSFTTPIIIPQQQPYCFTLTPTPTPIQTQRQQQLIINTITPVSQLLPEPTNSEKKQQQQLMKKRVFIRANGRGNCHRYAAAWRRKETSSDNPKNYYYDHSRQVYDHSRQVQCFNACSNNKNNHASLLLPILEDGEETTIMIKNIPVKYSRDQLVEFLDKHCRIENSKHDEAVEGKEKNLLAFDFIYLPIDFRSGLNKGYAFVNFTSPRAARKFSVTASNQRWDLFQSNKRREVVCARLQGKEKLQWHFESMHFPCSYEKVLPVFFSPPRDGATRGEARTVGKLLRHRHQPS